MVARLFSNYMHEYARRGWTIMPGVDRIYVSTLAQHAAGQTVGMKGYHPDRFAEGPYHVE